MTLGYDGKLYILAFDHRGSFQKKMFGIEGDPTPEQTETISDAKHLIFEGMLKAVEAGADPGATGVLVDEQFGAPKNIPGEAKERGLLLAMPVEKSGQNEFDFQYGDDFGAHIEQFDPDFSKVLVRYNPDGDAEMNERQTERLKRLADWLHEHDRKFLFELLVPAEEHQLEQVGGDADRYDAELRPELMRRTIVEFQDAGVEADIWKIEGIDTQEDCERIAQTARRDGRDGVVCVVLGPRRRRRQGRPLAAPGRAGGGLRRLRDRPHDLVGRAQGLPRREHRARGRGPADRRQLPALRAGLRRGGEAGGAGVSIEPGATFRRPPKRDGGVGSLPGAMRMRQSLAQFEEAFREEAAESVVRRERLRKHAVQRSRVRRVERRRQAGKLRFTLLALVDRGHRRGGHDRDVRDAGDARRLGPRCALRPSAGRAPRRRRPRPRRLGASRSRLDLEVDLLAEDRNGARRLDPDAHLLAHDREHRDLDVVADHDALVCLAREDKHAPRLPCSDGAVIRHLTIRSSGRMQRRDR